MAELFDVDVRAVSEHLQNIFASGESVQDTTVRKFRIVRQEGGRDVARDIDYFNLDAVIAVGYRVNSRQAAQFRISEGCRRRCTAKENTEPLSSVWLVPSSALTLHGFSLLYVSYLHMMMSCFCRLEPSRCLAAGH